MVTLSAAMSIVSHKSELRELPAPGMTWEWCEVVDRAGDGDGVSPQSAHAVREFLIRHDNSGKWETSVTLADYLQSKHGIELEGTVESLQQETLPVTGEDDREKVTRARVAGDDDSDGGTSLLNPSLRSVEDSNDVRQVSLTGDVVRAAGAREQARYNTEAGVRYRSRSELAERDPRQTTLRTAAARTGRFSRPTGGTYSAVGDANVAYPCECCVVCVQAVTTDDRGGPKGGGP